MHIASHSCTGCAVATNNRCGEPDGDGVARLPFARMDGPPGSLPGRPCRAFPAAPDRQLRGGGTQNPSRGRILAEKAMRAMLEWQRRRQQGEDEAVPHGRQRTQRLRAQRVGTSLRCMGRGFPHLYLRRTTGTEANLAPCRSFEAAARQIGPVDRFEPRRP